MNWRIEKEGEEESVLKVKWMLRTCRPIIPLASSSLLPRILCDYDDNLKLRSCEGIHGTAATGA